MLRPASSSTCRHDSILDAHDSKSAREVERRAVASDPADPFQADEGISVELAHACEEGAGADLAEDGIVAELTPACWEGAGADLAEEASCSAGELGTRPQN